MQVTFQAAGGVVLAYPGKGNHYWKTPPVIGDSVMLAPIETPEEPLAPWRVFRRCFQSPQHVICYVTAIDRNEGHDARKKA